MWQSVRGKEMDIRLVQDINAFHPIAVTPSGIVREVSPRQKTNAYFPICVTVLGMVTDFISSRN